MDLFDVSDGRCGIIVSISGHCLPFYVVKFDKYMYNSKKLGERIFINFKFSENEFFESNGGSNELPTIETLLDRPCKFGLHEW